MTRRTGNHIAGRCWAVAFAVDNRTPFRTRDIIGHSAQAAVVQVDKAMACQALPRRFAAGIQKRHDGLIESGADLMGRSAEMGHLLAHEKSKTLPEARRGDHRAGQVFTCYPAMALRVVGDHAQSLRPGMAKSGVGNSGIKMAGTEIDRLEPVGVVAVIGPWNFAVATPSWKIGPALACGHAEMWNRATLMPDFATALTKIITRQDISPGRFNLVAGPGHDVCQRLVEHRGIDATSLIGLARASHFRSLMRAGRVMVYLRTVATDCLAPLGVRGAFSFGPREQGSDAAEFHTPVKPAYVAAGVPE